MIEKIKSLFFPKEKIEQNTERDIKELLRENLSLVQVDIFYIDDPRNILPPEKLVEYDKKFYDLCRDQDIMSRIKYLINKQARLTIQTAKDSGQLDALGGININGMATIKDDFTRLGNSYLKLMPTAEPLFNKYSVFN